MAYKIQNYCSFIFVQIAVLRNHNIVRFNHLYNIYMADAIMIKDSSFIHYRIYS